MTTTLIVICLIINTLNGLLLFRKVEKLERSIASPDAYELPEELSKELSIQEHVILRENDFDRRIALMREELQNDGLLAHPNVKNLPHEIIDRKPVEPEIEVAN